MSEGWETFSQTNCFVGLFLLLRRHLSITNSVAWETPVCNDQCHLGGPDRERPWHCMVVSGHIGRPVLRDHRYDCSHSIRRSASGISNSCCQKWREEERARKMWSETSKTGHMAVPWKTPPLNSGQHSMVKGGHFVHSNDQLSQSKDSWLWYDKHIHNHQ